MLLTLLLTATPWPAPAPTTIDGCALAACTEVAAVKVCKCVPPGDDVRPGIVIEGGEGFHLEWDARADHSSVADFLVRTVELDGDGHPELLVANRASEASGFTLRTWELAIVDGLKGTVTHVLSQDFGDDAVDAKGGLLLTEWALVDGKLSFIGREYRYAAGRLTPAKAPVLRRALDPAFEDERQRALAASVDRGLTPRAFLSHPSTRRGDDAVPKKPTAVVVQGLSRDEPWLALHLQRADGQVETVSGELDARPALRLGDAKSRRLYPLGYAPADAEAWLVGKKVKLASAEVWLD